ncbi:MAG: OmpA family protein [Cyclobacteriaceae bacterium]|nr:OmpA family protein [Cyclobacteriaceae bacterium]
MYRGFSVVFLLCLLGSCHPGAFTPVNVGREYGAPKMPLVVTHLKEANEWAMARTKPHNIFQQILCWDPRCRQMIGRRQVLNAISYSDFKKRIKKNARKGEYKTMPSTPRPLPGKKKIVKDTLLIASPVVVSTSPVEDPVALPITTDPVLKADSLIVLRALEFETNSYRLTSAHYGQLDSLAAFLSRHTSLTVFVSGHTDSLGSERHNVNLSSRRAEVVAEYLVDHGASWDRITFEGFGSAQPLASNQTAAGRKQNRRVQVLIRKSP